jgi:hypothetical protein
MGGAVAIDAPAATGGTVGYDGGGVDGALADAPIVTVDGGSSSEAGGEAAPVTNICTGLTAAACDLAIRNAPVDNAVVAQDVPLISNTAYPACSQ